MWYGPFAKPVKDDDSDKAADTLKPLKCDIGDIVICKTYQDCIIPKTSLPWENERNFKVIGRLIENDSYTWAVYIPPDYAMKNGTCITPSVISKFGIEIRYKNDKTFFLAEEHIIRVHRYSDALKCSGACKQWFPMAAANQPDGSFVCWQCRENPWR